MPSKRNSFDRQHDLLVSAKEAVAAIEARFADLYHHEGSQPADWITAVHALKAAVAECEANP